MALLQKVALSVMVCGGEERDGSLAEERISDSNKVAVLSYTPQDKVYGESNMMVLYAFFICTKKNSFSMGSLTFEDTCNSDSPTKYCFLVQGSMTFTAQEGK